MESLLNFLVENWQYISAALVIILEIVLIIFKRRSKFVVQDTSIYQFLIDIINEAENMYAPGTGPVKKEYVISRFKERYHKTIEDWISYYKKTHPFDNKSGEDVINETLTYFIDRILSTPQSKDKKKM